MDAHRLGGELEGRLAGEQLGHPGLDIAAQAGGFALGGASRQQPGGLQTGRHVGQLQLDRLVLGDRLADRRPHLGVRKGGVERGPGDPDRPWRRC